MTIHDVVQLADLKVLLDGRRKLKPPGKSSLACLVIFAKWHDPAMQLLKVLEALAEDFPTVTFLKADVEAGKEIGRFCGGVSEVPAIFLFEENRLVARLKRTSPPQLFGVIKAWSEGSSVKTVDGVDVFEGTAQRSLDSAFVASTEDVQSGHGESNVDDEPARPSREELEKLVRAEPVMLFMKGRKADPFCKFSKAAVAILDGAGVMYGTFDVLSDEGVRQGLKRLSEWPTYPQLYIKGEFIGGVDILKELQEQGSLEDTFPPECISKPEEDGLTKRLRRLIGREKVMLFMKGKPDEPRCGFSRQVVEILQSAEIHFGHFDILEDNEVRQGLKKLSNWPTFPQLYSGGNLVGGVDIVKEIVSAGGAAALREEIEATATSA